MVRGIEKRPIFHCERDRESYAETLARVFSATDTSCLAWSFMPNHVHLLVRTGRRPLSHVMQRVGTSYARYFNRRNARAGYVFQGRYKALLVDEDDYLLALLRYIHLNPVRAGLVSLEALERHPWTGHTALMGRRSCPFQTIDEVLERFGPTRHVARERLQSWMSAESAPDGAPAATSVRRDLELGFAGGAAAERSKASGDPRVLGRPEFAASMRERSGAGAALARQRNPLELSRLIARVSAHLGANSRALSEGRRTACETRARAVIAYLAVNDLGLPQVEVAPALGVRASALSLCVARGAEIARTLPLSLADLAAEGDASANGQGGRTS
jgi:REP element-mobilizing transposase RayT